MGKIKSKEIKKAAKALIENGIQFSDNFEENKKKLGNNMPSKKIRNKLAGYITRLEKMKRKKEIVVNK